MPTLVGPGGPSLVGNGTATYYQSLFTTQYGSAAGAAYASYNAANPGNSAYANAEAFLEIILVHGLDTAISEGIGGAGSALGQAPGAVAEAASKLPDPLTGINAIGDFFQRLTQGNTWIRVAEFLLGLGLIVVGLAKLASGTAAGRTAAKVGKAAALL